MNPALKYNCTVKLNTRSEECAMHGTMGWKSEIVTIDIPRCQGAILEDLMSVPCMGSGVHGMEK